MCVLCVCCVTREYVYICICLYPHLCAYVSVHVYACLQSVLTDNEGASSEAVVARVNFIVRDNKPTIDLNGPELPG